MTYGGGSRLSAAADGDGDASRADGGAANVALSIRNLTVQLPGPDGLLTVVDNVNYDIPQGEVFGIVGESGSGKTISMLSIMGLLPAGAKVTGSACLEGENLLAQPLWQVRRSCGRKLAMVFQDPTSSLHPMISIEGQMTDHLRYHLGLRRTEARQRAIDLLGEVRIPDPAGALEAFPHQFSGGMRQRIAIAIALACEPKVLIADEPTTALDVTVQAGILKLIDQLRLRFGLTVILISHDLGVMSAIADRVSIFYAGRVVESGTRSTVLADAKHPYTRGLIGAQPRAAEPANQVLVPIKGMAPTPSNRPTGCAFHPRCVEAEDRCATNVPPLRVLEDGRALACPVVLER